LHTNGAFLVFFQNGCFKTSQSPFRSDNSVGTITGLAKNPGVPGVLGFGTKSAFEKTETNF
jgi:hypothetical protein